MPSTLNTISTMKVDVMISFDTKCRLSSLAQSRQEEINNH